MPDQLTALAARTEPHGPSADVMRRHLEVAAANRAAVLEELERRAALEGGLAQTVLDLGGRRLTLWADRGPSPVQDRYEQLGRRARRVRRARLFGAARTRRLLAAAAIPAGRRAAATDLAEWADDEGRLNDLHTQLAALGPSDPADDWARLEATECEWVTASKNTLQRTVAARLARGTAALQQLASMRRSARAARTAAVARTLPAAAGWTCTTLSAAQNFPLTPGLFDLVIVDEASQCSIADVLPVAYRAKRIMIVGGPNQLAPVVTLDDRTVNGIATALGTQQEQLKARHLAYGQDSAYTAFKARAGSPLLLEEHYRCHPDIAAWLNEQFYAGQLKVLTDVTDQHGDGRGLHWEQVRGRTVPFWYRLPPDWVLRTLDGHPGPVFPPPSPTTSRGSPGARAAPTPVRPRPSQVGQELTRVTAHPGQHGSPSQQCVEAHGGCYRLRHARGGATSSAAAAGRECRGGRRPVAQTRQGRLAH